MSLPLDGPNRQRPTVVTAAGYLLFLVAGLMVLNIAVSVSTISATLDGLRRSYAGRPDLPTLLTAAKAAAGFGIAIDVILVVLVIILGIFDLRGRNGMRITTWVIAGLGVLCLACGAFGNVTGSAFNQNTGTGRQITVKLMDIIPTWAKHVEVTSEVVSLLILIVVIILLALPAANTFFRKPPPTMMPMAYPGGYLPPGYPPGPGYHGPGFPSIAYPQPPQPPQDPPGGFTPPS